MDGLEQDNGELVCMAQNRTQWRACVDGPEQDTVESLCGLPRTGHSGELVWMAQNRTQWRAGEPVWMAQNRTQRRACVDGT